jgi:curved DNA-binding protein CbpA
VKPYTLAELSKTGLVSEGQLRNVIYTLAITRHLDLGAESAPVGVEVTSTGPRPITSSLPPGRSQSSPAAAPRAVAPGASAALRTGASKESPQDREFRNEIIQLAERIGSFNYYEILGVDEASTPAILSAAFFDLARKWHPDRLTPELSDVRELAARVFSRMTEAHQVLSNEEQRSEYTRLMKEGGATDDEQERVQAILRAATAFQKAEVLIRRGTFAEAEKEAKKAYEGDPEQAEYMALYADILSMKAGKKNFDDVLHMVNEARRLQEDNVKVHLYRARVLKRAGEEYQALREYQWVVERASNNVEAAREVRLYRMRKGTLPKSKPPGKGGLLNQDIGDLFGKIFKK